MRHTTKLDHRISARIAAPQAFAQWVSLGGDQWVPLAAARLLGALGAPALDPGAPGPGNGSATYTGQGARYVLRTYARASLQERKPATRKPRKPQASPQGPRQASPQDTAPQAARQAAAQ